MTPLENQEAIVHRAATVGGPRRWMCRRVILRDTTGQLIARRLAVIIRQQVLGRSMAYTDEGSGDSIVFLHGNPVSSYLWRSVLPHLVPHGRCIAPDLVGMGASEKLVVSGPGTYRFADHYRYLSALLDQLELGSRVTLVLHDWGGPIGL